MRKGVKIGIKDVNGTPIKNGDNVLVEFVNYMDSDKKYVDESFQARIFYHEHYCSFMFYPLIETYETPPTGYTIGHRSMRFTVMPKYKVVPQYLSKPEFFLDVPDERLKRVSYVYLHCELEDLSVKNGGYDIFSFLDEYPTKDGIYDCTTCISKDPKEDIECTLFFWKDGSCMGQHGLVVKNDDTKGYEDAEKKYSEKVVTI